MKKIKLQFIILVLLSFLCLSVFLSSQEIGDVNNSGNVDIVDALMTAQYYVGLNPSGFNPAQADVNADNSINIVDALMIAQYYVGLLSQFPASTNPTQPPAVTLVLQAEEAFFNDALIETEYPGYTGSGYVNTTNAAGTYLEWTIAASVSGNAPCLITFANGSGVSRPMQLSVNGNVAVSSLDFPDTGTWDTWGTVSTAVSLNAGSNTLRLTSLTAEGAANLDKLEITFDGSLTTPPPTTPPPAGEGPEPDPALMNALTGTSPISLHLDLNPGNYAVTVILGDASAAGSTGVQAEALREMLPLITTGAGSFSRQTFMLNVREPEGQPTGQGGTGSSGLDLSFTGSAPKVDGIGIEPVNELIVVYLAGDSTTCDQPTPPYTGWGQMFPRYFRFGVCIANYGDSGESSGSFLNNGALFPAIESRMQAGDYVFVQFGHNDKQTTAATFRANLIQYVNSIRNHNALPVLVTPPVRRLFDGSVLTATAWHINEVGTDLPAVMKQVAADYSVPLIDLTTLSANLVLALGSSASSALYLTAANDGVTDNTHFSRYGADEMAKLVINAMLDLNLELNGYLR